MTDEFDDERIEQLRAKRYHEVTERLAEREQKALNDSLSVLEAVTSRVEAGDRSAMLELLAITTAALQWREALPQQTRDDLAVSLEKMRSNLEDAKGFLPRGRGERTVGEKRALRGEQYWTAFLVEHARRADGLTHEDAIAKLAEESGETDSLIAKRWRRQHKVVKLQNAWWDEVLARWDEVIARGPSAGMLDEIFDLPGLLKAAETRCLKMPRRKKRQP